MRYSNTNCPSFFNYIIRANVVYSIIGRDGDSRPPSIFNGKLHVSTPPPLTNVSTPVGANTCESPVVLQSLGSKTTCLFPTKQYSLTHPTSKLDIKIHFVYDPTYRSMHVMDFKLDMQRQQHMLQMSSEIAPRHSNFNFKATQIGQYESDHFVGRLSNTHYFSSNRNINTYNVDLQCYILWVGIQ